MQTQKAVIGRIGIIVVEIGAGILSSKLNRYTAVWTDITTVNDAIDNKAMGRR